MPTKRSDWNRFPLFLKQIMLLELLTVNDDGERGIFLVKEDKNNTVVAQYSYKEFAEDDIIRRNSRASGLGLRTRYFVEKM